MLLYLRLSYDETFDAYTFHGIFHSIGEMVEFQRKTFLTKQEEDAYFYRTEVEALAPDGEFQSVEVIDSTTYEGEKSIITVCKTFNGSIYTDEEFLIKEIDTDTLKEGGIPCI